MKKTEQHSHEAIDAVLRDRYDLNHRQVAALFSCSYQLVTEVAAAGHVPPKCRQCGLTVVRPHRVCRVCRDRKEAATEAAYRAEHPRAKKVRMPGKIKARVLKALRNPRLMPTEIAKRCGCSRIYVAKIKQGSR
jgi:hypothetical protein